MDSDFCAEVTISSDLAEARRVQEMIEQALVAHNYSEHDIFSIKLALEEALVNAIKHGNQMDPEKRVYITYRVTHQRFDVRITDEGPGFNPADVPDPTDPDNIERACGRGLLLMRGFMTAVEFHGRGNIVTMTKTRGNNSDD
jgi:serine/threonine-protein kinase RsbW